MVYFTAISKVTWRCFLMLQEGVWPCYERY
jgi:hypothetical protein